MTVLDLFDKTKDPRFSSANVTVKLDGVNELEFAINPDPDTRCLFPARENIARVLEALEITANYMRGCLSDERDASEN